MLPPLTWYLVSQMRRPKNAKRQTKRKPTNIALMAVALLSAVAVSGCLGNDGSDNNDPVATMTVDDDQAWTGEEITFDAQASSDPDGEVTRWEFDFGDGETMTVESEDDARVKHAYAEGGEYTVTLTVTDDGGEQGGAQTATTEARVAINHQEAVTGQVLYSAPVGEQASESTDPFETNQGIDAFELTLHLESVIVAGDSEIRVQVLDTDGEVVAEELVILSAGEDKDIEFGSALVDVGEHSVKMIAESGAASITGDLELFYDEGY